MPYAFFNLRVRSLARGTLIVLASLGIAFALSGFPHVHPAWKIVFPTLTALWGSFETLRCLRLRWSFYHGGVLLLLYMDIMALSMILFLLLYPYAGWLEQG
jgi:hypothetical protein